MAAEELNTQVRRNPPKQSGRGGLITPLGGTRRGMDPQETGIGRWQQLLGTQVEEHVRA